MPCTVATVRLPPATPRVVAVLAAAALLLPGPLSAESSLQSGAKTASVGASAHLDFRIIIPPVLALSIESGNLAPGAAPRVSILSNTRHVMLTASAPLTGDLHAAPLPSRDRGTLLLGARRGSVISTASACGRGAPRTVAGSRASAPVVDLLPVVCTVTMP
jgi:hypothetical protein